MKKIVITGPRRVEIQEVPIPEPGEQMLLIKTRLSGVSAGTEMMLYRGTYPNFTEKNGRNGRITRSCPAMNWSAQS